MISKSRKILEDHHKKFLFLIWIFTFVSLLMSDSVRTFGLEFCKTNPIFAPMTLILVQIVFGLLILPCSPLSAIAGALWGFELGLLYSIIASLVSSTCTFMFGKFLKDKDVIKNRKNKTFLKINILIDRFNWMASAIAHANPIFPGSSIGYAFAHANIDLKKYILGALLGMLPIHLIIVGFGAVSINFVFDKSILLFLIILILGLMFLFYIIFVPKFLKTETLNKIRYMLEKIW